MALALANGAAANGEVPVAALIVSSQGSLIAKAVNAVEEFSDPTAHAELLVIRKAAEQIGDKRLLGTTLYVTLEPCTMCAGAIVLARISRVVFAAFDPKAGACGSLYNVLQDERLNHCCSVQGGVLEVESSNVLKTFFHRLRV